MAEPSGIDSSGGGLQSADFFRVLWRRRFTVGLVVLAGFLISYVYAISRKPLYEATARYELKRLRFDPEEGEKPVFITMRDQRTIAEIARSKEVTRRTAERLEEEGVLARFNLTREDVAAYVARVQITAVEGANLLEAHGIADRPELAASIANTIGSVLGEHFARESEAERDRLLSFLGMQIVRYEGRIQELQQRVVELDLRDANRANEGLDPSPARIREVNQAEEAGAARLAQIRARKDRLEAILGGSDPSEEDLVFLGGPASLSAKAIEAWKEAGSERNRLADRYTQAHPILQRAESEVELRWNLFREAALSDARRSLRDLASESARAESEMAQIRSRAGVIRDYLNRLPEERLQRANLEQEVNSAVALYQRLRARKEQLDVRPAELPRDHAILRDEAKPPKDPSYPNVQALITVGTSVGVLIAVALAFFLETLDTAISTLAEVERLTGHSVLAIIPPIRIDSSKRREVVERYGIGEGLLPVLADPRSPSSEAYRTLRTILEYSFFAQGKKTLLVTSATPAEGKTTTLANLAIAFSLAGRRTLMIAANMRHPVLTRIFAADDTVPGLSDFLSGEVDLAKTIQETAFADLHLLDSGRRLSRPSELLASPLFPRALAVLRENYDVILVDSPPVLPVADAATIAPHVDGALFVYFVGVPPRGAVLRGVSTLEATGGKVIGLVLNDIREASIEQFTQYYYYHRYPEGPGSSREERHA